MKFIRAAILVWLAAGVCVLAQVSRGGGPQSVSDRYGANLASGPNMFQDKPPLQPRSATANSTANGTAAPNAPMANLTAIAPEGAANGTAATTLGGYSVSHASDLANFPMPSSMEAIENTAKLKLQDQFVYQVLEDHEPRKILFVDADGMINVDVLGRKFPAQDKTLHELAYQLQKELMNPDLHYYHTATVLLAPYVSDRFRGHVNVLGQVNRPGYVDIPTDSVLTLWQALLSAGGFTDAADREHVVLMHNDPSHANTKPQEINVQKIIDGGQEPSMVVQPGDFINVPSKTEAGPASTIIVTGEVRQPLILPVNSSTSLTILQVMFQAGWTDWSDKSVTLIRYKEGKKTTQVIDVGKIEKGNLEGNIQLQPGDMIVVDHKWLSFQ